MSPQPQPQTLSAILHKAGFANLKHFMEASGLRIYENEHILRAWDMLEGMRGDYGENSEVAAVEKSVEEIQNSGGTAADLHSNIAEGDTRK
ncbi:hypothetical protein EYC84_002195 [Monilinia fructicola]|uniref:Uncharacterized protein n=1 Tax=Monilinia fructicola TaxID=38448 RepID=A0A5M9JPW5_MONFR|nr:hypothetical protein EYC84_002195 [Monilinia fructicola]